MAGEAVKAKKSLKQLTAEILQAAADLSKLTDALSKGKDELAEVTRQVENLRNEATRLLVANDTARREYESLVSSTANSVLVLRSVDDLRIDSEGRVVEAEGDLATLSDSSAEALEELIHKAEITEVAQGQYDDISLRKKETESELRVLEARAEEWKAKIARLAVQYENVKGCIEDALAKFSIFQTRIAKFSNETGYIIKYEDPNKLK